MFSIVFNLSYLQVEFGEFVTFKNYIKPEYRQSLLAKYLKMFFSNKTQDRPNTTVRI